MQKRGVRLGVVIAFIVAIAGAAFFTYSEHQRNVATGVRAREFDLARDRAQAAIVDARASLQAALVPGQGENYWLPRAATALDTAKGELARLKAATLDGAALNDLDAAGASLEQAAGVRADVAKFLGNDLRSQASRLVFSDGVESLTGASERIETARATAQAQREADVVGSESLQAIVAGGLVAAALVVIGLLLPVVEPRQALASAPAAPQEADTNLSHAADAQASASDAAATASARTEPASSAENLPEDGTTLPQRDRRKAPELRAAADICTDFARLVDGQEMPALLERAARLLDSTGFIVWIADSDGRQLRPSLAHGYSQATLAKLTAIPRHADNATAAAFRHAEMEIVRTNGMSPGAIVVPILGPNGCVGVMSAEVRHGREASESARALARIVAAQLATLISAAATQSSSEAPSAEEGARQVG